MAEPTTAVVVAAMKTWLWAPLAAGLGFLAHHVWRCHWRTHEDIGMRLAQIEELKAGRGEITALRGEVTALGDEIKGHMSEHLGMVEGEIRNLSALVGDLIKATRGSG